MEIRESLTRHPNGDIVAWVNFYDSPGIGGNIGFAYATREQADAASQGNKHQRYACRIVVVRRGEGITRP